MSDLAWGRRRQDNLVLNSLDSTDRATLMRLARPAHFPTRKTIFLKGQPGNSMLLIESGRVEISLTSAAGERSIIAFLGPGDCVGEMSILMGSERTADITAITDVTGHMISQANLLRFLTDHPQATLGILADLCRKLERTTGSLADHVISTGSARLAKVLADLFSRWGIEEDGGEYRLRPSISQSDLGEMSGLTRESVNRQIRAWEDDGILRREGRELVVCDPEKLVKISGAG